MKGKTYVYLKCQLVYFSPFIMLYSRVGNKVIFKIINPILLFYLHLRQGFYSESEQANQNRVKIVIHLNTKGQIIQKAYDMFIPYARPWKLS